MNLSVKTMTLLTHFLFGHHGTMDKVFGIGFVVFDKNQQQLDTCLGNKSILGREKKHLSKPGLTH